MDRSLLIKKVGKNRLVKRGTKIAVNGVAFGQKHECDIGFQCRDLFLQAVKVSAALGNDQVSLVDKRLHFF